MDIKKTQSYDSVELALTGRLDTTTAPRFQEALFQAFQAALRIDVDFAGVSYVSSAGLRVLLLGEKNAKASNKRMTLKNVSADIMGILEMTGFKDILTIE